MFDLEKAIYDPASVFKAPENVLAHRQLTREQKIEILQRWEYDVREREVAEEENMHVSGQEDILDDIFAALHKLKAAPDVEHNPPTKLGGCDVLKKDDKTQE